MYKLIHIALEDTKVGKLRIRVYQHISVKGKYKYMIKIDEASMTVIRHVKGEDNDEDGLTKDAIKQVDKYIEEFIEGID